MRTITVYAREKETIKEGEKKSFLVHYASEVNKNDETQMVYFDVKETKKCTKKLPNYNCEIGFEVNDTYFITKKIEKDGKVFNRNTLFLDDFTVIREIPKKVTTDEDLPF